MEDVNAVSGGFDPLHIGHIRLFKQIKTNLGGRLMVIINNDNWLIDKKGYFFLDEESRLEIIDSIQYVDYVVLSDHKPNDLDPTVCRILATIRPSNFIIGPGKSVEGTPERKLCEALGIRIISNLLESKNESSSKIIMRFLIKWKKQEQEILNKIK